MSPRRIYRLRSLSARRESIRTALTEKLNLQRGKVGKNVEKEGLLLATITRPLTVHVELLRSSSRQDESGEKEIGDPYIGMIIPEDIAIATMILLIDFPTYRPEGLRNASETELIDLFINPLVRSSQNEGAGNAPSIHFRHVITFLDPAGTKGYSLDEAAVSTLSRKINADYSNSRIQYAGIRTQEGCMSITGGPSLHHDIRGRCLFMPVSLMGPSGASTLQRIDNGFDIHLSDTKTHRAFLHTTLGFSGLQIALPGDTNETINISGDVHYTDRTKRIRVEKSVGGDMMSFLARPSRLKAFRKRRNQGEVLGHTELLKFEGFRELYDALIDASVSDFYGYHTWLSEEKNRALVHTCITQLNHAGYLTANIAPDWSVGSGYLSESLGLKPNGLWKLRDDHFADGKKQHRLLLKGAGNNQGALRNISRQKASGWHTEGIGDSLYVDMVLIFSRMIGISIPALSSKTYIRQYIAYHIIDTLRGKYRRNKANQYGGIDVRPDEMTIDKVSLLSIQRKIQSEITKVNAGGILSKIDTHGEFEGEGDQYFLDSVAQELRTLHEIDIGGFFRDLIGLDGVLKISELLIYGCYPFDFTWGDFRDIPQIYRGNQFDLIASKRSSSHQDDHDFYQGLSDTISILAPGGLYITDGIRQSYTRILRLSPEQLDKICRDPNLKIWMIVDYTKNPNEVQSIIIYKKDLANNEKDELVEGYIEEQVPESSRLVQIGGFPIRAGYDTHPELVGVYSTNLNSLRLMVRDQIGPGRFDQRIHHIIEEHTRKGDGFSATMMREILIHLMVKTTLGNPDIEMVRNSVTRTVDAVMKQNRYQGLPPGELEKILANGSSGYPRGSGDKERTQKFPGKRMHMKGGDRES